MAVSRHAFHIKYYYYFAFQAIRDAFPCQIATMTVTTDRQQSFELLLVMMMAPSQAFASLAKEVGTQAGPAPKDCNLIGVHPTVSIENQPFLRQNPQGVRGKV